MPWTHRWDVISFPKPSFKRITDLIFGKQTSDTKFPISSRQYIHDHNLTPKDSPLNIEELMIVKIMSADNFVEEVKSLVSAWFLSLSFPSPSNQAQRQRGWPHSNGLEAVLYQHPPIENWYTMDVGSVVPLNICHTDAKKNMNVTVYNRRFTEMMKKETPRNLLEDVRCSLLPRG